MNAASGEESVTVEMTELIYGGGSMEARGQRGLSGRKGDTMPQGGMERPDGETLPEGANLFPVGALSLVKNVAVLRFFCAVSGWKNQVPTFFKARQEKGSLSPACEWFPETEELVRSDWDRGNREMRVYAALRVSQLSITE